MTLALIRIHPSDNVPVLQLTESIRAATNTQKDIPPFYTEAKKKVAYQFYVVLLPYASVIC